jgi:transporter family protein
MKNLNYALIIVFAWGLWAFLPKIAVRYISPPSALIYEVMIGAVIAIFLWRRVKPEITIRHKGSIYAFINGVIGYGGVLFYIFAISKQDAILVAPLSATYPIVTLFLGAIFLKERLSRLNYIGILLALVAIYLILA